MNHRTFALPKVRRTPTVDSQPGKRCTEQDTPDSMASGWIRIKARDGKCDDHLRVNSDFPSDVRITRETYLKNSTRPPSDARCQTARLPPASITPKINESLSIMAFHRSTLNDRGKKPNKHDYRLKDICPHHGFHATLQVRDCTTIGSKSTSKRRTTVV